MAGERPDVSSLIPNRDWATLLEQPEALRAALEAIELPAFAKDPAGRYLACNQAFAVCVGRPVDKLCGQDVRALLPNEVGEYYHRMDCELARTGLRTVSDGQFRTVDGELRPATIHRAGFLRADGSPAGMVGVVVEVSARHKLERDLRLKRLAFEQALIPIGLTSRDSRVIEVNQAFAQAWGFASPEEVVGLRTVDLVADHEVLHELRRTVATQGRWSGEITARRRDGSTFTVLLNAVLVGGPEQGLDATYALTSFVDITARREAELALQASERNYRQLVENVEAIILRLDPQGRITFANRYAQDFFGYTEAEMLGRHTVGLIVPEVDSNGQPLTPLLDDVVVHPEAHAQNENENITKDGRRVWVSWTNRGNYDEQGRLIDTLCVGVDQTARREAELALAASERKYRELVENVDAIILRMDREGRIRFANRYAQAFFGYSEAEMVGRSVIGLIVPEYDSRGRPLGEQVRDILRHPESYAHHDNENLTKDGRRVWVSWTNRGTYDEQGELVELLGVGIDQTARREADAQLRVRQAAIHSSISAIVFADLAGTITYANPAFLRLYGLATAEQALGTSLRQYLLPLERGQSITEMLFRRGRWQGGGTTIRSDGRPINIQVSANLVIDEAGQPVCLMASFLDVTEQEQLREEAYRAHKLDSLGILAGGIAHDFNNLLTGLLGQLEMTRRRLDPTSRAAQELRDAEATTHRARHLTQQLLTFATGGAPIRRPLHLGRLLTDMLHLAAGGHGLAYELDLAPDLAAVEADEGQLSQVINNLALNARQAMPASGRLYVSAHNVELTYASGLPLVPGPYVRVVFRDEGPGIPAELLSRVFDPYFTTKPDGSGLGLTIAYSILKKHDGHLGVESPPEGGAVFTLYLPACEAAVPADEPAEEEEPPRGAGRILVMDDDPMIRRVAGTMLRHLGYEVLVASEGEEACALHQMTLAERQPLVAAILDLTVRHGLGGEETARRLRATDPSVRLLACSGYANDPIMADCHAYGFDGVVEKPFRSRDLARALAAALGPAHNGV